MTVWACVGTCASAGLMVCVCKLVLVCLHDGVFCVMVLVCCVGVVGRRARGWVCAWAGVHDECVWKSARGQAWRVDKCATVLRLLGCQARPNRIPRHNDHWSVRQRRTHVVLTAPPCSPAGTQPTKLCGPHFYAARPTTSAGEAAQPARDQAKDGVATPRRPRARTPTYACQQRRLLFPPGQA